MRKEIEHRTQIVLNGIGGGVLIIGLDPAFVIRKIIWGGNILLHTACRGCIDAITTTHLF
jgi:hypothetical protein